MRVAWQEHGAEQPYKGRHSKTAKQHSTIRSGHHILIHTLHYITIMSDLTPLSTDQLLSILEPITIPSTSPLSTFSNWAKTFTCKPSKVFLPTTVLQCRVIVEYGRRVGKKVRPVGVGHSPSDLALTDDLMVRMTEMKTLIDVSRKRDRCHIFGTSIENADQAFFQLFSFRQSLLFDTSITSSLHNDSLHRSTPPPTSSDAKPVSTSPIFIKLSVPSA